MVDWYQVCSADDVLVMCAELDSQEGDDPDLHINYHDGRRAKSWSLFLLAISKGATQCVHELIRRGVSPNKMYFNYQFYADTNALATALVCGQLGIFDYLLECGANINDNVDRDGNTIMFDLLEKSYEPMTQAQLYFLLDRGCNPKVMKVSQFGNDSVLTRYVSRVIGHKKYRNPSACSSITDDPDYHEMISYLIRVGSSLDFEWVIKQMNMIAMLPLDPLARINEFMMKIVKEEVRKVLTEHGGMRANLSWMPETVLDELCAFVSELEVPKMLQKFGRLRMWRSNPGRLRMSRPTLD